MGAGDSGAATFEAFLGDAAGLAPEMNTTPTSALSSNENLFFGGTPPYTGGSSDLVLANDPTSIGGIDSGRVRSFQDWAKSNGLYGSTRYIPGVLDDPTRAVFEKVNYIAARQFGGDMSEAMSFIGQSGGVPGGGGSGGTRQPYTAPAFQPLPDEELESAIRDGLAKATGKRNPNTVQELINSYRAAEKRHYDQLNAAGHAEYEGAPSAGTIEQLPTPDAFAFANVEDSKDAGKWRAATALLTLDQQLRSGGL